MKLSDQIGNMSAGEINFEVNRGGRFVVFQYCVSALVVTFRRPTAVHFIKQGESAALKSLPFTLLSLFAGWWGFPWGFIYTPQVIYKNLKGGLDVTGSVLQQLSTNPAAPQDARPQQRDEVTRMIREGVHPQDLSGRMALMGDKLTGNVLPGVDASSKTARKLIGGAGSLLTVLKFGILGGLLTLIGLLFTWAGLQGAFNARTAGIGVLLLGIGVFALRYAYRAWFVLRAISRA